MKTKLSVLIIITTAIGLLANIISSFMTDSPISTLIGLLKYFTIWSNIFILLLFISKQVGWSWLDAFKGGIYINITVTMVVFITMLSWMYQPVGIDIGANIMNHYITPVLALIYLFLYENKADFTLNHIKLWLVFPLYYLAFALNYSAITRVAIYPFFDFIALGMTGILVFVFAVFVSYILLSLGLVKIFSRK